MPNHDAIDFASRLQQALSRSTRRVETAAELAIQFNLRHHAEPITQQAAQKWLKGKAKPTLDKVHTLADWLGVAFEWLYYGRGRPEGGSDEDTAPQGPPTEAELVLLRRFRSLGQHQQELISGLIEELQAANGSWVRKPPEL